MLFPTEDGDFFYAAYSKNNNERVNARGSLYNFYKIARKELRVAGILLEERKEESLESEKREGNKYIKT